MIFTVAAFSGYSLAAGGVIGRIFQRFGADLNGAVVTLRAAFEPGQPVVITIHGVGITVEAFPDVIIDRTDQLLHFLPRIQVDIVRRLVQAEHIGTAVGQRRLW